MADRAVKYRAQDITVLDGLEAIRRRPGMYVGDVRSGLGLHHMLWELVANSIDEHLAGYASRLRVSVEGALAEVEDDGRGIPVELVGPGGRSALEIVLTVLHAGATFDGHLPHVHIAPGGFGIGLVCVNALSEQLEVEVRRNGFVWLQRFARGRPVSALERGARSSRTGTRIRFLADRSIFVASGFDRDAIGDRLEELAVFNPELTLELMARTIREPRGTRVWIERLTRAAGVEAPADVFVTRSVRDDVLVDVALGWTDGPRHELRSYAAQHETADGGSHERGLWQGLVLALTDRRPRAFERAPRASRLKARLSRGLFGVVHVLLSDPRFAGPTRDRLESDRALHAVRDQVRAAFGSYLAEHPRLERALLARLDEPRAQGR